MFTRARRKRKMDKWMDFNNWQSLHEKVKLKTLPAEDFLGFVCSSHMHDYEWLTVSYSYLWWSCIFWFRSEISRYDLCIYDCILLFTCWWHSLGLCEPVNKRKIDTSSSTWLLNRLQELGLILCNQGKYNYAYMG